MLITMDLTVSVFFAVTTPPDMTSYLRMAPLHVAIESEASSRCNKLGETPRAALKGRTLVLPVVGAWDADFCDAVVVPERPARD